VSHRVTSLRENVLVTPTVDQYAGEKVSLVVIAEAYVNAAFAQGIVEINYKHFHQATNQSIKSQNNVNVMHAMPPSFIWF
jgi:hypothetical protein